MKKISRYGIVIRCMPFFLTVMLYGQEKKEKSLKLKNTIHFNLTNPMIFGGKSIVVGYERLFDKRHSFSFNIGTTDFPNLGLINEDSVKLNSINDEVGFHVSADYRFYLAKENKYDAPRGVYIGPYYSYNYFKNNTTWLLKPTNSALFTDVRDKIALHIHTIGFELGYQFVFWDRLTIDMVLIGPGIGMYNLETGIEANLSSADQQKLFSAINEAIADRFPGYSIVVDERDFKSSGTSNTTALGYRYLVQIGFRF